MKKYLLLPSATVAIVCWVLLAPHLSTISAANVTVTRATVAQAETTVDCSGTLQASSQQTVTYGYPVMAEKVCVKPGDTVTKGQLLLKVDRNETAAAFAAITVARAASSDSTASSDSSSSGSSSDSELDSSTAADIQQYLSGQGGDIDSLISEYYGTDGSSPNGTSSASDSDGTDSAADTDISTPDVPDAVYAAVSGVVTSVNASDGTFTQPTIPLVVVSDTSRMQVKSQVDESQISRVKTGQTVRISSDAFSGTFTGQVSHGADRHHRYDQQESRCGCAGGRAGEQSEPEGRHECRHLHRHLPRQRDYAAIRSRATG